MSFDLFKDEAEVVAKAEKLLDRCSFVDPEAEDHYKALLADYQKLLKSQKRLMRISDRNEEKLTAVSKNLDEKNKVLEDLSGKLARYLSPQVFKSIFAGDKDVTLSTERKKLTVFFSDIKNFTLTTDDLQPEDLTFLLNSYFTEMSAIALSHGATIDKFIGDAMLMFFGDPETKGVEEDAKACVRMALAMQERMASLRGEWKSKGFQKPFAMRIGINTGYCNVGNFGSQDRMDYTIIGGEVNLAARLEASADPGGILMSHETYLLVKDIVSASEREPIQVKGIRREVRNFAVAGPGASADPSRLVRLDRPGLRLEADLARLGGEPREQAVAGLADMVSELRRLAEARRVGNGNKHTGEPR